MARKILVAPITVSPTKPLTPTHLKYLLTIDVLCRATARIADVTCVYDHHAYADGRQTVAFCDYLDRICPGTDYSTVDELWIGEHYVRHHAEQSQVSAARLEPYVTRVRTGGWLHPSALRMLDIWEDHYRTLGLFDPLLGRSGPPRLPVSELVQSLAARDLCIDGRPLGAPVYLDLTAQGIPLRPLISAELQANYLVCVLGQLIPIVGDYDLTVLMYDRDLRDDYVAVERVLSAYGATVARFEVDRVAINGVTASSRRGGWQGYTLPALRAQAGGDDEAFQLGLRLYLIAGLGRSSIEIARLRHWVARARRLLDAPARRTEPDIAEFLSSLAKGKGYVDPYRLTSSLLSKSSKVPTRALLETVQRPMLVVQ